MKVFQILISYWFYQRKTNVWTPMPTCSKCKTELSNTFYCYKCGIKLKNPPTTIPTPIKLTVVGGPSGYGFANDFCNSWILDSKPPGKSVPYTSNSAIYVSVEQNVFAVSLWHAPGLQRKRFVWVDGCIGPKEFNHLRALSYQETDVFILPFDKGDENSFNEIPTKWTKEIRKQSKKPIILVGVKNTKEVISNQKARQLMVDQQFVDYCEVNLDDMMLVDDIFRKAILLAVRDLVAKPKPKRSWSSSWLVSADEFW